MIIQNNLRGIALISLPSILRTFNEGILHTTGSICIKELLLRYNCSKLRSFPISSGKASNEFWLIFKHSKCINSPTVLFKMKL